MTAVRGFTGARRPGRPRAAPALVGRFRLLGLFALIGPVVLTLGGCAGPTRDDGAYREQARLTSQAALSLVRTAVLAAQAELDGRSLQPFSDATVSNAESDAGSVQTTFDSRQPPDATADRLRKEVDQPLGEAVDGLQALRIAQRRGDAVAVGEALHQLRASADALDRLQQELS
jgi:hypothetical protein